MIKSKGGVFGRNPTFNEVTVDGNMTVNGGMTVTPNADAPTSNVTIGPSAGTLLESDANSNILIGNATGDGITTGDGNIAIGGNALGAATSGNVQTCVAIGNNALLLNTANQIVAIGANALDANTSGTGNVAVGFQALTANSTGAGNTAIGWGALAASDTSGNTAVGEDAGRVATGGSNTYIGRYSGYANGAGNGNTCVGTNAIFNATSGGSNTAIGTNAGRWRGAGTDSATSMTSSVLIGNGARVADSGQSNQVVIAGTDGLGQGSNTTTLGNSLTTGTYLPNGTLYVQETDNATSTTTGALQVAGGVGVGGALHAGADAVVNGVTIGTGVGIASVDANTRVGRESLSGTGSQFSTAVGFRTGTGGVQNGSVFIGSGAGYKQGGSLTTSTGDVMIGQAAGQNWANDATSNSSGNVLIGNQVSRFGIGVSNVVAVGVSALNRNRTSDTVAVGANALYLNTLGTGNVAVGRYALYGATTGVGTFTTTPVAGGTGYTANQTAVTVTLVKKSGTDTFSGTVQASLTTDASGVVTAVAATPVSRGIGLTGSNIIFEPSGFGGGSGCEISIATLVSGLSNTAVGSNALDACTTGSRNLAIGHNALGGLTLGSDNLQVGVAAGPGASAVMTGHGNCIVGHTNAAITTGLKNVIIGCGQVTAQNGPGATLTTGDYNIIIGHGDVPSSNTDNSIYISAGAANTVNDGSNTTVIGNTSTTSTRIPGGNLTLSNGNLIVANGNGIDFGLTTSGTGTMTSELLDDYEEGTFTPSLQFGGASTAITYHQAIGVYTKIGRVVHASIRLNLTSKGSATGNATIAGLPFATINNGSYVGQSCFYGNDITAVNGVITVIDPNATTIGLAEMNDAGARTTLTDADFVNTSQIVLQITYFV